MTCATCRRVCGHFGLLLLGAVLVSCGPVRGYPGKTRAAAEVATIRPNPYWSGIGVVVTSVDGMEVNGELAITVLPGRRELGLRLVPYSLQEMNDNAGAFAASQAMYNAEWRTPATFAIEVDAERTYAIAGRWENEVYVVELQDYDDKTVLATKNVTAMKNRD